MDSHMRLTRIKLTGYSRFRDADCTVNEPVIAFVGPNEAGKSTLLRALDWLTDPKATSLPLPTRNREHPPEDYEVVVSAVFIPSSSEIKKIIALDLDTEEDLSTWTGVRLAIERQADGTPRTVLSPTLHRNPAAIKNALTSISKAGPADALDERAAVILDSLEIHLDIENVNWNSGRVQTLVSSRDELQTLADELTADTIEGEGEPEVFVLLDVLTSLESAIASVEAREPDELARELLEPLVPRFLLFKDEHRTLPAAYNVLNNDGNVPPALVNLLTVAGSSIGEIATAIQRGATARQSTQKNINEALSVIADYWSQNRTD